MSWGFETDEEFQEELDWIEDFVRTEIEPLDFVIAHPYDLKDPIRQKLIPPLQEKVRARGLWACHLGPELGGPGYGQVKLALDERDPRALALRRRSSSAARRPTRATPRSSRTTARPSRRRNTSSPCWRTRSSRASR